MTRGRALPRACRGPRAAKGAWGEREALYLTPGGLTSGRNSMIEALSAPPA